MIKSNSSVKGLTIDEKTFLISQYADDTTLFLHPEENSLREIVKIFDSFSKVSGLKMNIDKTEVLPIGSLRNTDITMCNDLRLNWTKGPVRILGVLTTANPEDLINLNYLPAIEKVENTFKSWASRDLTPYGKITITKSLALSKITMLFLTIPSPPLSLLKKLESAVFKFIWNDKPDKIKRGTLIGPYSRGGLELTHIESFNDSLKLSWVKRLIDNKNYSWKWLIDNELSNNEIVDIWKRNITFEVNTLKYQLHFSKTFSDVGAISTINQPLKNRTLLHNLFGLTPV
jgi:hypothetical protein